MNSASTTNPGISLEAPVRRGISLGIVTMYVAWLVVVVSGTILLARYSNTPGNDGAAPSVWPVESQIPPDANRPTLVMFVHPRCACTRASLGELEMLQAQVPGRLGVRVVFLKPADTTTNWEKSDLWNKAVSIPGVSVYSDDSGIEARRFHAETSGQTLLYDRGGALRFQGGITLSRGHSGDNPGRSALQEIVREGHSDQVKTPVFGCSLFATKSQP